MAFTRYFLRDSTTDTGCDGPTLPLDMSKTQGTSANQEHSAVGNTAYTLAGSYQINVTADSPVTGSQTHNLSISVSTIQNCNWRVRLRSVDDSDCTRTNSSAYQTFTDQTAEIKTFSLTLDFTSADEDLELEIETQETSTMGQRRIILDVNDADSYVDAPWPASSNEEFVLQQTRSRLLARTALVTAAAATLTYTPTNEEAFQAARTRKALVTRAEVTAADVDLTYDTNGIEFELARTRTNLLARTAHATATDATLTYTEASAEPFELQRLRRNLLTRSTAATAVDIDLVHSNVFTVECYDVDTGGQGDYSSLSAFEAAQQQDLVDNNVQIVPKCRASDGSADTSTAAFSGWTTGATNKIVIKAALNHGGSWNASLYRMEVLQKGIEATFNGGASWLEIDGLQIKTTLSVNTFPIILATAEAGDTIVKNTITWQEVGSTNGANVNLRFSNTRYLISNVIAYGQNIRGIWSEHSSTFNVIENCTVVGPDTGIDTGAGTVTAINNICQGNSTAGFSGTFSSRSSNNVSDDGTAPGNGSVSGVVSFANRDGRDYRLSPGDRTAKGRGIDLRYDATVPVTHDAAGNPRPAQLGTIDPGAIQSPMTIDVSRFGALTPAVSALEFELHRARGELLKRVALVTSSDTDLTYLARGLDFELERTRRALLARLVAASSSDVDLTYDVNGLEFELERTRRALLIRDVLASTADLDLTYLERGLDFELERTRRSLLERAAFTSAADVDLTYTNIGQAFALERTRLALLQRLATAGAADADLTYDTTDIIEEFELHRTRQRLLARIARTGAADVDLTYLHAGQPAELQRSRLALLQRLATAGAADVDLLYTEATLDAQFELHRARLNLLARQALVSGADFDLAYLERGLDFELERTRRNLLARVARIGASDVDLDYLERSLDFELERTRRNLLARVANLSAAEVSLLYSVVDPAVAAFEMQRLRQLLIERGATATEADAILTYIADTPIDTDKVLVAKREGPLVRSRVHNRPYIQRITRRFR